MISQLGETQSSQNNQYTRNTRKNIKKTCEEFWWFYGSVFNF